MSRRRQAGSVRFDPYWKVQWWDERSLTWRDIQKAHHSREEADQAIDQEDNGTYRLMKVTETGRAPEPDSTRVKGTIG